MTLAGFVRQCIDRLSALYPEPEQRPSSDEDLLIDPKELARWHRELLACGLSDKDGVTGLYRLVAFEHSQCKCFDHLIVVIEEFLVGI